MTMNDLFNQHINLSLFILDDLKATANQKNLFKNLARQLQKQMYFDLLPYASKDGSIAQYIHDSVKPEQENEKTK